MFELIGGLVSILIGYAIYKYLRKTNNLSHVKWIFVILFISSIVSIWIVDLKVPFENSLLYSGGKANEFVAMLALVSRLVFSGTVVFVFIAFSRIKNHITS
ncbi:hypothetical protein K6Y31_15165 [Motilimonas cestriensis]|uniref:Uncharacterized protein n=1 Tax=Motilimonas cestriensis TaxID=2742685 RepID=A0ABS8WAW7_9GAMM|nr:hypothetical protein [Motilimonas cestriensis]MCE2596152.1 hypothetical protein [Motilimonas cestriensis]